MKFWPFKNKDVKPPKSKTFCVMPWFNLSTETNGKCKMCCVAMSNTYISDNKGKDLHIQKDPIEKIWNSKYLRLARKKMLAGKQVAECRFCYEQEDNGIESPRQVYNRDWYSHEIHKDTWHSRLRGGRSRLLPQSLEPRPGNLCNLKCTMCWSMSSSKVYQERLKALSGDFGEIPGFIRYLFEKEVRAANDSDFKWSDHEIFISNIQKCLPELRRLYFTGGEPLLNKANLKIMNDLAKTDNKYLNLLMTTNLTILEPEFLRLLQQYSFVNIYGSIDGVGEINDYIRYPSKWKTISENFIKLKEYPNFYMLVMTTVQAFNALSVIDLMIWLTQITGPDETPPDLHLTYMMHPEFMTIRILGDSIKEKVVKRIDQELAENNIHRKYHKHLKVYRQNLMPPVDPVEQNALQNQFVEFCDFNDRVRKLSARGLFPELFDSFAEKKITQPQLQI